MNSDTIWQILRYIMLMVGGYFVHKGTFTEDTLSTIVGVALDAFTFIWGVYVKLGTKATTIAHADRNSTPTASGLTGTVTPAK